MANTNVKVTQAQVLNAILAACEDGADFGAYGVDTDEVKAYCEKKIAQMQNKTAKVDSAKIAARAELFEGIKVVLDSNGNKCTASEIMKAYNADNATDYSLPKITNALTAMANDGVVVRVVDKKTPYFSLAD